MPQAGTSLHDVQQVYGSLRSGSKAKACGRLLRGDRVPLLSALDLRQREPHAPALAARPPLPDPRLRRGRGQGRGALGRRVWPLAGAAGTELRLWRRGQAAPGARGHARHQRGHLQEPAGAQSGALGSATIARGVPRQHLPAHHAISQDGILVLQRHQLAEGLKPALLVEGVGASHDYQHGNTVDAITHVVEVIQDQGTMPLKDQQERDHLRHHQDGQRERVHAAHHSHDAEPQRVHDKRLRRHVPQKDVEEAQAYQPQGQKKAVRPERPRVPASKEKHDALDRNT
mmetsp:Transcript_21400/g.60619  ORF Transcript_21400/g.60619 Transcript_21400/m.60619 type:complete len:286 (+) Transcript_21400:51-908(+)